MDYDPLGDDAADSAAKSAAAKARTRQKKKWWTFVGCAIVATIAGAAIFWPNKPQLVVQDIKATNDRTLEVKLCARNLNLAYGASFKNVHVEAWWLLPETPSVSQACDAQNATSCATLQGHCAALIASTDFTNSTPMQLHLPPSSESCAQRLTIKPTTACFEDMLREGTKGAQDVALLGSATATVAQTWTYTRGIFVY